MFPSKDENGVLWVPLHSVCESLIAWLNALDDSDITKDESNFRQGNLINIYERRTQFMLAMTKSNLLYRLLYLGEPLRTEKCPVHKGHWTGCNWREPFCDCQKIIVQGKVKYDSNITGWLLEGNPDVDKLD